MSKLLSLTAMADGVAKAIAVDSGSDLTELETAFMRADIKAGDTAVKTRRLTIDLFEKQGRERADLDKGEGEPSDFYLGVVAMSFEAMGGEWSTKGAPAAFIKANPKGYNIRSVIEGDPKAQPEWVTAKDGSGSGKLSVRQYHQAHRSDYINALRKTWDSRLKAIAALTATPNERTADKVTLILKNVTKVINQLRKLEDTDKFSITEAVKMQRAVFAFMGGKEES